MHSPHLELFIPETKKTPIDSAHSTKQHTVRFVSSAGVKQMRLLVLIGSLLTLHFLWWFADTDHIGYAPLFWALTVSLVFKMLRMLHEWYHYVHVSEPVLPAANRSYKVDILTTACPGEPLDMILGTLRAMQAIRYPHTSYLCDEGNDPVLRAECARLGVVHVTRDNKVNAKAGNINNALQQATGELCVVLDPDHAPTPDFLDQVVPYFQDSQVGYVQVVQAYGNQGENLVALGAAEQTYHYYGPLMMGMNHYNTPQAIGANCTFRRTALDSIGGHAAGLTEDMHTAMRLHAAGWKSVYAPKIVSRGLVPSSLAAYYAQQLKWSRGAFDLLVHVYPRLFARFSWRQRLHYLLLPLYFFSGVVTLIDLLVPILAMVLAKSPWHLSLPQFALHMTPVVVMSLLIRYHAQRWLREPHERGLHLTGGLLRLGTWWIYLIGFVYTLIGVRVPYIPTPKEGGHQGNEWKLNLPNLFMAALCLVAAKYGRTLSWSVYTQLMSFVCLSNAVILLACVGLAQHELIRNTVGFAKKIFGTHWLSTFGYPLGKAKLALSRKLQTGSIPFAFGLALVHLIASLAVSVWLYRKAPTSDVIWARTGSGTIHVGPSMQLQQGSELPTKLVSYSSAHPATSSESLVELETPPALTPTAALPQLRKLDQPDQLVVLSWQVQDGAFSEVAWRRSINDMQQRSKKRPLLLRPIITAPNALAYRAAWHRLVNRFAAAGDTSIVWVWTPPHIDAVADYFPGAVYVDWIAADLREASASLDIKDHYRSFRLAIASQVELNSKPIIMLAALNAGQHLQQQAKYLTRPYPEIKAVVFTHPTPVRPKKPVVAYYSVYNPLGKRSEPDTTFLLRSN